MQKSVLKLPPPPKKSPKKGVKRGDTFGATQSKDHKHPRPNKIQDLIKNYTTIEKQKQGAEGKGEEGG